MLLWRAIISANLACWCLVGIGCGAGIEDTSTGSATSSITTGATDVAVSENLTLTFSAAVDATTVTAASFYVVPATSPRAALGTKALASTCDPANAVSATISCASNGLACTLTFATALGYATQYTICVTSAIQFQDPQRFGFVEAFSQDFTTATETTASTTYTVGGAVSGLSGTLILQNNATDDLSVTADGAVTFPTALADAATYAVTITTQPSGQTCTVTNGSGTISSANVSNVSVSCSTAVDPDSSTTYTVGGAVSGLSGTLVLQNNGADDLTVTADGAVTFPTALADAAPYAVTVTTQPSGQTCTVTNGSGTISSANVSNVSVACSTDITVSSVTSSTSNGSYTTDGAIAIQVNFSGVATVTGTPTLTLETGTTDRTVNYSSGSGTTALTFTYTVQSGDSASDLDYTSTSALALNGGTITDSVGNSATLTLPTVGGSDSLAGNKALVVDTASPTAGNSGTLTASALATVSYTVTWTAATDSVSAQAALQYLLYRSTSDNLDSVANIEANGTAVGAFTANDTSTDLTSLNPNTTYFFNVIVKDEAGNKTAYTSTSQATANSMFLFSEGTDRDGDLKTAGGESTARASGDSLCSTKKTASHAGLNCTNIRVFLTISADDEIRDFPTLYGVPTSVSIISADGVGIDNDWNSLLDGNINTDLKTAGVLAGFFNFWWSGSTSSGAVSTTSDNNVCTGFTSNSGGGTNLAESGVSHLNNDGDWIENGVQDCSTSHPYLCLCW
jgi:hypothetical protein